MLLLIGLSRPSLPKKFKKVHRFVANTLGKEMT